MAVIHRGFFFLFSYIANPEPQQTVGFEYVTDMDGAKLFRKRK
jgi:hypothetical protein